jgi:hypothetical protein
MSTQDCLGKFRTSEFTDAATVQRLAPLTDGAGAEPLMHNARRMRAMELTVRKLWRRSGRARQRWTRSTLCTSPTPTQSTCLYYYHDNEASKCVQGGGQVLPSSVDAARRCGHRQAAAAVGRALHCHFVPEPQRLHACAPAQDAVQPTVDWPKPFHERVDGPARLGPMSDSGRARSGAAAQPRLSRDTSSVGVATSRQPTVTIGCARPTPANPAGPCPRPNAGAGPSSLSVPRVKFRFRSS